ncbi:hypothetical protein GCM10027449_05990 [Sinomonas notoginsengisoli]|uniref:hypothetical protein n=1 Tax=Sinomonas notoginsengisoli TaxID=1457311 RepID=UPI001F4186AD|nr:hypothetical protein [Sinomonas notoginsengisoli]
MAVATAVLVAATFVWLGMVLAISFIEAPLKFQAPGITVELGVGIGRLVFKALNIVECVLAAVVLVMLALGGRVPAPGWALAVVLAVIVMLDVAVLRRRMDRRVTSGNVSDSMPRNTLHFTYVGLEVAKVAGLLWLGILGLVA